MKKPAKPKKTLAEEMGERLQSLAEARRQKVEQERRAVMSVQEDEVMRMTHGPDWKARDSGEPEPTEEEPELKAG